MLTAEGCRERRVRLRKALANSVPTGDVVLTDPLHLRYFANLYVEPFSYSADFGCVLAIAVDGSATLYRDNRLPVVGVQVDKQETVKWYDGVTPGTATRRAVLAEPVKAHGGRIHDSLADPLGVTVIEAIGTMRRSKFPDEIAVLRQCMRITEAGHAWARKNVKPGMSELDVYLGVQQECCRAAGHAVIVYGDFAVSPGMSRKGGPPTTRPLAAGELFILDYSVILYGYRSDFTNTIFVGPKPRAPQKELFDACAKAMLAGEKELKPGASCQAVYDAVRAVFDSIDRAEQFPHHAGHGIGLSHPEAPFFVRQSTETLVEGDVVTLEPGLYVDGVGGIRIENNYLITAKGFEKLSRHKIALT